MKKWLLTGIVLIVAGFVAHTVADAQEAKAKSRSAKSTSQVVRSSKSAGARAALCRADCTPQNYKKDTGVGVHGIYRSYADFDPKLQSAEGRASFNQCVGICTAPLPDHWYAQRAVFALGMNWFGKTPRSCLDCHASVNHSGAAAKR